MSMYKGVKRGRTSRSCASCTMVLSSIAAARPLSSWHSACSSNSCWIAVLASCCSVSRLKRCSASELKNSRWSAFFLHPSPTWRLCPAWQRFPHRQVGGTPLLLLPLRFVLAHG